MFSGDSGSSETSVAVLDYVGYYECELVSGSVYNENASILHCGFTGTNVKPALQSLVPKIIAY
jgi:hypothetical protein